MRVLGITTGGDCGAAVVEDGRILAAVNEERLARIKLAEGFPRASIRSVLALSGTEVGDLDAVLVAATRSILLDGVREPEVWLDGWDGSGSGGLVKRMAGALSPLRNRLPFLEAGYYALLQPSFAARRRTIRRILREEMEVTAPIRFVDHHFCHLTSAYFTSGFDDALVVSLDGGGDGRSGLVHEVRDGAFRPVAEMSSFDSLGNYYAYVTILCGFKAMRHEGKITGLAAYGEPVYLDLLRELVDEEGGGLVNRGGVVFKRAVRELERRLPTDWTREDLAASIQAHFEDVTRRIIGHWARATGQRNVAVAGGVFANVRVNEEVHDLPEVDRLSVHPHMGDGGLAVGAALAACVPGVLDRTMPFTPEPLADVYLGPDLTDAAVDRALRDAGLEPEALDAPLHEVVADRLAEGWVVARAAGRMEYGPRALGNRSILYQPTDRSVNDWLNKNLRRTEFMPFAPSMLAEHADACFENVGGSRHPAEFMTITFHATPWMTEAMEGVMHIDGTARPQLVRRDRNPGYYAIIDAFHRRTGLPAVINTSFNMHEEPIVCSADDCVRAFLGGNLDYLAIGPHLVKHPGEPSHALRPVRAAEAVEVGAQPAEEERAGGFTPTPVR